MGKLGGGGQLPSTPCSRPWYRPAATSSSLPAVCSPPAQPPCRHPPPLPAPRPPLPVAPPGRPPAPASPRTLHRPSPPRAPPRPAQPRLAQPPPDKGDPKPSLPSAVPAASMERGGSSCLPLGRVFLWFRERRRRGGRGGERGAGGGGRGGCIRRWWRTSTPRVRSSSRVWSCATWSTPWRSSGASATPRRLHWTAASGPRRPCGVQPTARRQSGRRTCYRRSGNGAPSAGMAPRRERDRRGIRRHRRPEALRLCTPLPRL